MASQGYYDTNGGNYSTDQLLALTNGAAHSGSQSYGSLSPPPVDPHRTPSPQQGYVVDEQPKYLYGANPYQGPKNNQATYHQQPYQQQPYQQQPYQQQPYQQQPYQQQPYQNSYPDQQGYPVENQQRQQGSGLPTPYDQRDYAATPQQNTSSYPVDASWQGHETEYNGANDKAKQGTQHSERGLGGRVAGIVVGRKLAKEADLGPVATLAAGMIGGQMLSNVQGKHKQKKHEQCER